MAGLKRVNEEGVGGKREVSGKGVEGKDKYKSESNIGIHYHILSCIRIQPCNIPRHHPSLPFLNAVRPTVEEEENPVLYNNIVILKLIIMTFLFSPLSSHLLLISPSHPIPSHPIPP
jgi:hypothetical protein